MMVPLPRTTIGPSKEKFNNNVQRRYNAWTPRHPTLHLITTTNCLMEILPTIQPEAMQPPISNTLILDILLAINRLIFLVV